MAARSGIDGKEIEYDEGKKKWINTQLSRQWNIKVSDKLDDKLNDAVSDSEFASKSEFIRDAVRKHILHSLVK